MNEKRKAFAVVNPNSANGSTADDWDDIHAALREALGEIDFEFTKAVGDAAPIARNALKNGYDFIVCVGGDGTNNEIVNGFFDKGRLVNHDATLGFICRGTGGDLRKTLDVPKELDAACRVLAHGDRRVIDVGRFSFVDSAGSPAERYFINITSFGIGGEVDDRVNRTSKALGGFVSFLWASLVSIAVYKNKNITLKVDDNDLGHRRIFNVAVANGRFFGGGMMVAPQADPADGLFDIVVMGDLSKLEIVTQMGKIYKGGHLKHPKVEVYRGKTVEALSDEIVLLDVDGEQPGRLPIKIEIVPKALGVMT